MGPTGARGPQGSQGLQGPAGGPQGFKGDTGPTGSTQIMPTAGVLNFVNISGTIPGTTDYVLTVPSLYQVQYYSINLENSFTGGHGSVYWYSVQQNASTATINFNLTFGQSVIFFLYNPPYDSQTLFSKITIQNYDIINSTYNSTSIRFFDNTNTQLQPTIGGPSVNWILNATCFKDPTNSSPIVHITLN
jgi:hypothetical protein